MSEHLINTESAPSFGERRGHRLAPLNTNIGKDAPLKSNVRLQRPRPHDYPSTNGQEGPVPLQSPVHRQSSKSSLRNLFSRDKSARAAVAPDTKLTEIEESQPPIPQTIPLPEGPLSPALTTPRTEPTTPTTITSPTTPRARATLRTTRPRPAETEPTPSKEQIGWKPPPLFQAYPQSLKHESLSAPAMSADSILRLHATAGKSAVDDARNQMGGDYAKKREQKERKHLRTLSGTINKVEWTQKTYVLATTGFILQYAGEGKHDRLPEKMLQLGPKSVAFASDAIPGKHWVVQVSQNSAADAAPDAKEPSKSKFASRFGFHRSNARRLARSFLLVFDNPDSMISWLMAIRAEIESRGGPKFTMEKHSDDDEVPHQLRNKSSIRQMVKKDPRRISSLFLQPQAVQTPDEDEDGLSVGGLTWQSRRSSFVSVSHRSMVDSRAGSTSTGLTESTPPVNGYDGFSSFTAANAPVSPPIGSGAAFLEELPRPEPEPEPEPAYARSPPSSSHDKRQSLYGSPRQQPIPVQTRPEATHSNQVQSSIPETLDRCASPPAPNFSVPSFSKKFTSRQNTYPTPQTSYSPPNYPQTLRRGESTGESTGDFSVYSTSPPPQSPTYSIASSRQTDSSEPPFAPRDGTRRALRPSNSEDALSRIARSAQGGNAFARLAREPGPSDTSPPSSRPLSFVGRAGLGIHTMNENQVQNLPPLEPTLRTRVSTVHTDYQNTQNMSRRKSMPGLTLGPPAAPPPNCPLPKIPSPIAAQAPPWASKSPAPTDRFYQSQQVREHVEDVRKSTLPGATTAASPAQQSASKTAARQSRMI